MCLSFNNVGRSLLAKLSSPEEDGSPIFKVFLPKRLELQLSSPNAVQKFLSGIKGFKIHRFTAQFSPEMNFIRSEEGDRRGKYFIFFSLSIIFPFVIYIILIVDQPEPSPPPTEETSESGERCTVCMTNPREFAFQCGHTCCHQCNSRIKNTCRICRAHISQRIRLF